MKLLLAFHSSALALFALFSMIFALTTFAYEPVDAYSLSDNVPEDSFAYHRSEFRERNSASLNRVTPNQPPPQFQRSRLHGPTEKVSFLTG